MKKLLLGAAALAATATALWAPPHYGYVGNRGGSTVVVFDAVPTASVLGAPANPITVGTGPTGMVSVQLMNRVYCSNSGSGTVSVIHGDLLVVVNTIMLPNTGGAGTSLGGMALSEDRSAIYLAGHTSNAAFPPNGQAGIWRIDLPSETATYVAGVAMPSPAVDCEVIRAAQVGGTGDAPGKVYFSIPGANQVRVYDVLAGSLNAVPLSFLPAEADTPQGMERAPDHSFLLVGSSSNTGVQRIGKIVPGVGAADAISTIDLGGSKGGDTLDVAFDPTGGPTYRTFACGFDLGASRIYDFNTDAATVVVGGGAPSIGVAASVGFGCDFDPLTNRLWVGDASGTGNQLQEIDTQPVSPPPTLVAGTALTTGLGPGKVAFLLAPKAPSISVACPKGEVIGPTSRIVVRGAEFRANSIVRLGVGAGVNTIPTTFVNPSTLIGDTSGVTGSALFDVYVRNPDLQIARLNSYYQAVVGAGLTQAFPVNLPPFASGYEMKSFPQYATVDELKLALQQQIGPYNPVFYRIFIWYQDHYVELNKISNLVDDCDLSGRAFFGLTRFGHPLTLSALDVTLNASGTVNVIPLTQGWNMISVPWLRGVTNTILWGAVQVSTNSDLSNPLPAPGGAFLSPLPYERINHQYVTVNALTAGRGYWVYNYTGGPAYLLMDLTNVNKPGDPPPVYTAMAPGDPGPPPPPEDVASESSGSSGGGCGFLGPELLLLALAFHRLSRRRRLGV